MNKLLICFLVMCLASADIFASMNVSYLNTTVILNSSTSGRVVETVLVNITNNSISQYEQYRQSLNLTLGDWGKVLRTNLLIQHIFNPNSNVSEFEFIPGPIINRFYNGNGQALLTMSYIAHNITTVENTGPRTFQYQFVAEALNFQHTQNGESLPENARLNIIIPKGTQANSVYPAPDYPYPRYIGNYKNVTSFTWDEGEPLQTFSFSYIYTESLQDEVTNYFSNAYTNYTHQIYLFLIVLFSILAVYIYVKVFV